MADVIKVTNNLYLFIPNLIPSVETQIKFNEATQINYKIAYDEYYTARRLILDMIVQVDIRSAQQVSSPKYFIFAHQTQLRLNVPNKNNNIARFDNLDLRKYYVETDSVRYLRDSALINYEENIYITQ